MTEQFLDHKSPGFKQLIESVGVNSLSIQSNHSNIVIANKIKFLLFNNQALSDCGKFRFKTDDIVNSVVRRCPQNNIFLHFFFIDRSSIHCEIEHDPSGHIDLILKAIETDTVETQEDIGLLPLCDCCLKYEQDINQAPESHPISVIMKNCHSSKLPVKIEFGFGAISYCHEGTVSDLNFSEGCVKFNSHSNNKLNLSRVHSLLLNQEKVESSRYTTLSTYSSHGEKIYTLSVHHTEAYTQWERTLSKMCVRK